MDGIGIVFSGELCAGCYTCVVACTEVNGICPEAGEPFLRQIIQEEHVKDGSVEIGYSSLACRHCKEPACVPACRTGAIYKDEGSGAVGVDLGLCVGCKSCLSACPYDVPNYSAEGKMYKCNGCVDRRKQGLLPACVKACPFGALKCVSVEMPVK